MGRLALGNRAVLRKAPPTHWRKIERNRLFGFQRGVPFAKVSTRCQVDRTVPHWYGIPRTRPGNGTFALPPHDGFGQPLTIASTHEVMPIADYSVLPVDRGTPARDGRRSADLYSVNTVSPNATFSPENAMKGADPCEPTPSIKLQDAASLLPGAGAAADRDLSVNLHDLSIRSRSEP